MEAGGGGYRPQRVVDRQLDVVGLAPAGDLARFADAPDDAQVDAGVVEQLLFDQQLELPLAAKLLARRQGHRGLLPQPAVGGGVLRPQRIFDEEGAKGLHLATEADGVCRAEPGVDVEAELQLIVHRLPYPLKLAQGEIDGPARLHHVIRPVPRLEADAFPALIQRALAPLHHALHAAAVQVIVGEHPVAYATPQ